MDNNINSTTIYENYRSETPVHFHYATT